MLNSIALGIGDGVGFATIVPKTRWALERVKRLGTLVKMHFYGSEGS
jgi:hypothetical protein